MSKIDNICKIFANSFHKSLYKNEDKNYLKSEHAIYMLVFSMLLTDINIKENNDGFNMNNSKFYDLMIMLKDLNEGEIFDKSYCKDCFKFSKLVGYVNISNIKMNLNKKPVGLYKNGKYKQYRYYKYNI